VLSPKEQEPFSFIRAARILFRNDQALIVVAVMVLFNAASCMHGGTMLYYFTNVAVKPQSFGVYSIITGLISGAGLFGVPLASKKFERNKVYLAAYIMPCIFYVLMFIQNIAAPANFLIFAILSAVPNISYGAMSMMQSVMLSDAVDYGEWKYGERNEGIIFSMLTFLSKISNGISYLIRYSGFAAVKFDTQVGAMASLAAIKMIKFLLFAVPPMFLIAAFLLHKAKFKLVPAYMSQITDEIKLKRASLENSNGVLNNE
jgi:melibiose permease